ncbi:MAG TPA: hypothetical protein DD473_27585 [Planctomycetaceae bacterium]|nr:hypothetical protein [Planctomycetaceae bacterium]
MKLQNWITLGLLNCVMVTSMALAEIPRTPSKFTPEEIKAYVEAHNVERRLVGAPLAVWDDEVAAYAQAYADHLAKTGKFEHYTREVRKTLDQGENLYWTSSSERVKIISGSTASWAEEKINENTGAPVKVNGIVYDDIEEAHPGHVLGHYTQMVWARSTKIGAGIAQYQVGDKRGRHVVVGRYAPRGNRGSQIAVP